VSCAGPYLSHNWKANGPEILWILTGVFNRYMMGGKEGSPKRVLSVIRRGSEDITDRLFKEGL
jgi:hypothetical protein